MLESLVEQREKGEAPISIGTSLAIESLAGFGEFPSDEPPITQFDALWVNLRTLFRNLFNAIERTAHPELGADELIDALTSDMQVLQTTVAHKSNNRLKVMFYVCRFHDIDQRFPDAKRKHPTTDKQIHEYALEQNVLGLLLQQDHRTTDMDVVLFDTVFNRKGGNVALLTHYPIDLLWRNRFENLVLLESHTGHLKQRAEWYTKLTNGKRLNRIPFNRLSMQVFGDGNLQFSTMAFKTKQRLLALAEIGQWHPLTTDERINLTLNQHANSEEQTFFKTLMRQ